MNELFDIYKRNFPFIVRAEQTVYNILGNKDNVIVEKRNEKNELIGVSVINKNTIMMLCVDKQYRSQGIGTELLATSESTIRNNGYNEIVIGNGFDYLMPGVPTSRRYFSSVNENLRSDINETASDFFTQRGYKHSWECNCFDMRCTLSEAKDAENSIGDTVDGINYRWATISDMEGVCNCTDDAFEEFTQWYKDMNLYSENNQQRVLIAAARAEVVGTLIVNVETEGKNIGSFGCITVKHAYQGKHIATNLITIGTKYLKDIGLREAHIGYTYTGLDRLYGYAGYKICIYYMMAKKI